MSQLGQTRKIRLSRLTDGRCPIHGISMKLMGEANGLRVVHCPRVIEPAWVHLDKFVNFAGTCAVRPIT
jgi:hypothetical protein